MSTPDTRGNTRGVMFVVEIARGEDGMPYSALGAFAGAAYVVSLVWLRFRR